MAAKERKDQEEEWKQPKLRNYDNDKVNTSMFFYFWQKYSEVIRNRVVTVLVKSPGFRIQI